MNATGPSLSVIIPALDEAARLPSLLDDLRALPASTDVVVVDGGSTDDTVAIAEGSGAHVVKAATGRGPQLRAGARASTSEWLFFVHADCRLDRSCREALLGFIDSARLSDHAHFRFALDNRGAFSRFIEHGQRLRQRWLSMPYGDQGLVVSSRLYAAVGGYPEWPIMEDVGMMDRLARAGARHELAASLVTSGRRYEAEGGLLAWLRNVALVTLFRLGVPPHRLASWYEPHGTRVRSRADSEPVTPAHRLEAEGAEARRRAVAVFAKAPVPGRVKTRLAADVGNAEAMRIYRTLGRTTVDALRGGPYRLVVYVAPPTRDAFDTVREWLGEEGVEYRPQAGSDLGARMAAAMSECLTEADNVCLVGTDIPGIDQTTLASAFDRLRAHDVVLGPAIDGGYYLIGTRRDDAGLFEGVRWSTECVLRDTLARADSLGATAVLLDRKSDVDVLADVPEELLAG